MIYRLLTYEIDCGFCLWQPGVCVLFFYGVVYGVLSFLLLGNIRFSPGGCCGCTEPCDSCEAGTTPDKFQVDVPADTFLETCSGDNCDNLEGTFVLDQRDGFPCSYRHNNALVTCGVLSKVTYSWHASLNASVDTIKVQVSQYPVGGSGVTVQFSAASPTSEPWDCSSLSATTLTFSAQIGSNGCTSSTGKTITITSL